MPTPRYARNAATIEGANSAAFVAGGGRQFIKNFVGLRPPRQTTAHGTLKLPEESLGRRALKDVMTVFFNVIGQLHIPGTAGGVLDHPQFFTRGGGNAAPLEDVRRDKHRPQRCRPAFRLTPCTICRRQAGEDAGRRLVTTGEHIGRVVVMPLDVDIHRHRRVIARSERIALTDIALRRPVADHRNAEGERNPAVLPDPRRRP